MEPTVDARGLACPQPVIQTRNALKALSEIVVVVDNEIAQRNVTRMAQKSGHQVRADVRGDGIYLHIWRAANEADRAPAQDLTRTVAPGMEGGLVLVVSSEFMGRGEHPELGKVLIRGFFHTLGEVEPVPDTIIFFNSGVKLVAGGSPVTEDLCALAEQGVEILACGTCLDYYGLQDQVVVGEVSNMYTIAESMLGAAKLVQL